MHYFVKLSQIQVKLLQVKLPKCSGRNYATAFVTHWGGRLRKRAAKALVMFGHGYIRSKWNFWFHLWTTGILRQICVSHKFPKLQTKHKMKRNWTDISTKATVSATSWVCLKKKLKKTSEVTPPNKGNNKKVKTSDLNEAVMKSITNYEKRAAAREEMRKTMAENKGNEPSDPLFQFFMSMYNITKNCLTSFKWRGRYLKQFRKQKRTQWCPTWFMDNRIRLGF